MSILDNEGHDPNGLGNQPKYDGRLVGWCTRCGGEEFNGIRHRCRPPNEDAGAMIEVKKTNQRLRAALERISAVQLGPQQVTDPAWEARLMQGIAREALAVQQKETQGDET